jgi:anaerobic selenocysteine-containing dehydrogenase
MGEKKTVYSICGMCSVRCPIAVEVENGRVRWISGNPHDAGMGTALCAKGIAGRALLDDMERPLSPLIRDGERGRASGVPFRGMRPWTTWQKSSRPSLTSTAEGPSC